MKKITNYKLRVTCYKLQIFYFLTFLLSYGLLNAQTDESKILDTDSLQKNEVKIPPEIMERMVTQLKNEPAEKFYRYGIKNKEQLENLQFGRPIRDYIIDIDNDTLMPQGWRVPVMYEGKALFIAFVAARDSRFGTPAWGESIRHYEREDLMGILHIGGVPGEYYYIRRDNQDVFIQVVDLATHEYFKNEYSFSEIISLKNRALEIHASPTKEGLQEIYGTNHVEEKDIFDTNFPQKHELIMTPEITEMLTTEIYWSFINDSDWNLSNFGITNRVQLENLHLGKPIPQYQIDFENENLIFTGEWDVPVMSDGEPLFIARVSVGISEDEGQYSYTGAGGAGWAKILHSYEYKDLIIGYISGYPNKMSYLIIRKEQKDIFVNVPNKTTGESFKEYTFREIINLLKK